MNVERKCPACGQGLGLVRRVSTVAGHRDIVVILMVCGSCSHEWSHERASPGIAVRPAEAQ
jgi:C4-type Zn-finger protein